MSKIVELLTNAAELEKKAYSQVVTTFSANSIAALAKSGVPFEKAASMVEAACEENEDLSTKAMQFMLLEKAASYVSELEAQVLELTKVAGQVSNVASVVENTEQLDKLASLGFSKEEIETMKQVDAKLLDKMASVSSSPMEMGSGVGFPREKTDPLLDFILG